MQHSSGGLLYFVLFNFVTFSFSLHFAFFLITVARDHVNKHRMVGKIREKERKKESRAADLFFVFSSMRHGCTKSMRQLDKNKFQDFYVFDTSC